MFSLGNLLSKSTAFIAFRSFFKASSNSTPIGKVLGNREKVVLLDSNSNPLAAWLGIGLWSAAEHCGLRCCNKSATNDANKSLPRHEFGGAMPWAVAVTRPCYETKVIPHLERQGMEFFLPRIRVLAPGRLHRIEPLFPRYFFCSVGSAWRQLLTTIGISSVLMSGEKPALLPDHVVIDLKARCDAEGVYIPPPPFQYLRGMKVKIKCGPFSGRLGVVQGMRGKERVSVLIDIIQANIFEGDLTPFP